MVFTILFMSSPFSSGGWGGGGVGVGGDGHTVSTLSVCMSVRKFCTYEWVVRWLRIMDSFNVLIYLNGISFC